MTIRPGLVSVTFRQLSPQQIIDLCIEAGLNGIEWGGDVHVPHGDVDVASAVRRATVDAELSVAAYGAYYRAGQEETHLFDQALVSAVELGAPCIRVWAGQRSSDSADVVYWRHVVNDMQRITDLAQKRKIDIVLEFHQNTLTDTVQSTVRLLKEVGHPAVFTYWQPPRGSYLDENLAALDALAPWLYGLHVFAWHEVSQERLPLAAREGQWRRYIERADAMGKDMYALLEFVQDDEPSNFRQDAATLKKWLS